MASFLWIVPKDTIASASSNRGLPFEYLLPSAWTKIDIATLIGSTIWMLVSVERELYLFGKLIPEYIERFDEGLYRGDYLLNVDRARSYRIAAEDYSDPNLQITTGIDTSPRLSDCPAGLETAIIARIRQGTHISLALPNKETLDSIELAGIAGTTIPAIVEEQVILTNARLALAELSASPKYPRLSPIANTALHKIISSAPQLDASVLALALETVDPLAYELRGEISVPGTANMALTIASGPMSVDTFMTEIIPALVVARTFIANLNAAARSFVDKTDKAEADHQRILKDCAAWLSEIGYRPMQSRSIDLLVETTRSPILFEVKSANCDNFLQQGEKALVQLLRYYLALKERGRPPGLKIAVIQWVGYPEQALYLERLGAEVGIKYLFYREESEWPYRLEGIQEILSFGPAERMPRSVTLKA